MSCLKKATILAAGCVVIISTSVTAQADISLWEELTSAQQTQVQNDQIVRVDGTSPNFWDASYYTWIHHQAQHTGPRGCAAVFWDLPGQVSYQPSLLSFVVTAGQGTTAVKATATVRIPTPGGPVDYSYPQENTIFRIGNGANVLFTSSWETSDPNTPISPAFPFFSGDVSFQSFPGDGGGSLMKYRVKIFPIAAIVGDSMQREQSLQILGGVVQLHKNRMQQGATEGQLRHLAASLH